MTFLHTPADSPLTEDARRQLGYVPNFLLPFTVEPEIHETWERLLSAVRQTMTPLRYELVTLVAARALNSRYCTLAHASVVRRDALLDDVTLAAALTDPHRSGLPPAEIAVLEFAAAITADPQATTPEALDRLRAHGLSERDILHVVSAVAARKFFTTVLGATGTTPDEVYDSLDPELVKKLLG